MSFNPIQAMSLMMNNGKGFNPMHFMMNQLASNPMFKQAQQMAQGKSVDELKATCENICRQKGIDFEQAWAQFQSQFPGVK